MQWVATVLTACGIETSWDCRYSWYWSFLVATVLTACGIETHHHYYTMPHNHEQLQQYLPLAVLKHENIQHYHRIHFRCNSTYRLRYWNETECPGFDNRSGRLQQYLPLAVLKQRQFNTVFRHTTVGCNSTYRLRYWNLTYINSISIIFTTALQQYLPLAVLKLKRR